MSTNNEIVLTNVGPIEKLVIPVPSGGGVVVLRGRNGSGKSTALAAVDAVTRGQRAAITPRDGSARGEVRCLGAVLRVGKKIVSSGELEIDLIEDDVQPAAIVDPGIIDADRREAARIRGVLRLIRAEADPDAFQLVENHTIDFGAGESDAVTLAMTARKAIQQLALAAERESQMVANQAESIKLLGVEPHPNALPVDVARNRMIECAAAAGAMRQRRQAWKDSKNLGSLDTITTQRAEAQAAHDAAVADKDRRMAQVADARRELAVLEATLKSAEEAVRRSAATLSASNAALSAVQKLAGVEPASDDDVRAAEASLEDANRAFELAQNSETAASRLETYLGLVSEQRGHAEHAERLRQLSVDGVEDVLTELVNSAGSGLSVRNGMLCVRTSRSDHEPFEDLSHSQRWLAVLHLVVDRLGRGSIIAIPQETWDGMDTATRETLHAAARATGIVVLTAEAADGELHVANADSANIWE